MRAKYIMFLTISFIVIVFSWYYVICFCGIYAQSSSAWILAGLLSLVIDNCIIQITIPLIVSIIRYIATEHGIMV